MLRPYGESILVKQDHDTLVTKSGIVIPDTVEKRAVRGIVAGIGEQYKGDIRIGDIVLFAEYAGAEIIRDRVEYLVLKEVDILGILV